MVSSDYTLPRLKLDATVTAIDQTLEMGLNPSLTVSVLNKGTANWLANSDYYLSIKGDGPLSNLFLPIY